MGCFITDKSVMKQPIFFLELYGVIEVEKDYKDFSSYKLESINR